MPTRDAIDRIFDRVKDKIIAYRNAEIKEFYQALKTGGETEINITLKNFNVVYNQWKASVRFKEKIEDEQDFINLFLVDILNGAKYKKEVEETFLGSSATHEVDLIRDGTNLSHYAIMYADGKIDGIKYQGTAVSSYYTIADAETYAHFWRKYKRPPERGEFLNILERSAMLYSDKYRRDTGGEYTPHAFVSLQNELLAKHGYNMDSYIVFDPCAGVGNLENQFGRDYKRHCYLSTLEQMDVDTCKIKGFENAVQFDFLKDWKSENGTRHSERSEESVSQWDVSPSAQHDGGAQHDGLAQHDSGRQEFDFRVWLRQFEFSEEAKNLFTAALEVFRYYHATYPEHDWNDSFYDITNAIMGKDTSEFKTLNAKTDTRITRVKTTKGTRGFGRNTIKYAVPSSALPTFINFFDARDVLARKINRKLLEAGLLLWERGNVY